MSRNITMDTKKVIRTVSEIVEDVSTIAISATRFREEIETEAGRSNATFLENLTKGVSQLEANIKQVKNIFLEIQDGIEAYSREFERFNQDSEM